MSHFYIYDSSSVIAKQQSIHQKTQLFRCTIKTQDFDCTIKQLLKVVKSIKLKKAEGAQIPQRVMLIKNKMNPSDLKLAAVFI